MVEAPNDTVIIPDGAALMAYQYFENVRNFLVAVEELGLPTFEASDLEQVKELDCWNKPYLLILNVMQSFLSGTRIENEL